jgi:hypothetical protein
MQCQSTQFIKQILLDLRGEIGSNKMMGWGEASTSTFINGRSSRLKKINKEASDLNYTIDQVDLTDFYRIFHLTAEEYTFFSSVHGAFFRTDHILGHKIFISVN